MNPSTDANLLPRRRHKPLHQASIPALRHPMENDSTRRRRLLPPRYPSAIDLSSSHHHRPSRPPFQYNPANHFTTRVSVYGSGWSTDSSYQTPPSPALSHTSGGVGAGVGGSSAGCHARSFSQGTFSGSSYYQMPQSPLTPTTSGGGVGGNRSGSSSSRHGLFLSQPSFLSSFDTGLATLVAPAHTPPQLSFVHQAASSSSGLPPRPSQSTTIFGSTQYELPPLPPSLPPLPTPVNLDVPAAAPEFISVDTAATAVDDSDDVVRQYVDLDGLCGLNSSGDSTQAVHDHLAGGTLASSQADGRSGNGKKEAVSWEPSLLGTNTNCSSSMNNITWMPKPYSESKLKLPLPSPGLGSGAGSRSSRSSIRWRSESRSMDDATAILVAEFADGTFTEDERKKIMADKRLAVLVLTDPKRVRRILHCRRDSIRCRDRKIIYQSDLEHKVEVLQKETDSLSARVQSLQSKAHELTTENNELRIRLNGLEQQSQLKNVLNETLSAEVHRLKLDAGEINGSYMSNSLNQEISFQMIQPEHLEIQNQVSLPQQAQEEGDHENFITDQILGGNFI